MPIDFTGAAYPSLQTGSLSQPFANDHNTIPIFPKWLSSIVSSLSASSPMVRDNGLFSFSRQKQLLHPTNITDEIVTAAFQLFKDHYKWEHPIRSLGIRAVDLVLDDIPVQLDLFGNQEKKEKLEKLDRTVDEIRRRFGYFSIQRAAMYQDKVLSHLDAGTHTIHPHSYFHG